MTPATFTADSVKDYFGYASHWLSTCDGERIHYLDEGTGERGTVLLVHGSAIGITAAANFYLTIGPLVRAGYRVLAPDLYGYGWTQAPAGMQATRPHHVAQLVKLLDALKVEQAWVIGNSLGGMVSSALAIQHPQRILGNIVIGTAGARWKHGSRFEPNLSSKADAPPYERAMVLKAIRHLVHDADRVPPKLVEYRTLMAERPGDYERHLESTRLREESKRLYPFNEEAARQCPVPALFIYGREDRISPPEDALAGAEAFAHADLVVFGHCGHWTMVERADDFNALMLRFLDGYAQRIVNPPDRAGDLFGRALEGAV